MEIPAGIVKNSRSDSKSNSIKMSNPQVIVGIDVGMVISRSNLGPRSS